MWLHDQVLLRAVVENHKVSEAEVLFHLQEEDCKSAHKHKVGLDAALIKPGEAIKGVALDMQ